MVQQLRLRHSCDCASLFVAFHPCVTCPQETQGMKARVGHGFMTKLYIFLSHEKEKYVYGDPDKGTKRVVLREKIVFYNEKHALIYGPKMKEYLGATDTEDPSILEKSLEEIREMNLPKDGVRDLRRRDLTELRRAGKSLGSIQI